MKKYLFFLVICLLFINCKNEDKKEMIVNQSSFEEELQNILTESIWINLNYEANISTVVIFDKNKNLEVTSYRGADINNVIISVKGYWNIENDFIRGRYIDNLNSNIIWTINNEITEITNNKGVVFTLSKKEIPQTIKELKTKYNYKEPKKKSLTNYVIPEEVSFDGKPEAEYEIDGKLCILNDNNSYIRMKFNNREVLLRKKFTSDKIRKYELNEYTVTLYVIDIENSIGEDSEQKKVSGVLVINYNNQVENTIPFIGYEPHYFFNEEESDEVFPSEFKYGISEF